MERLTHIDNSGWYVDGQSVPYDEKRRGKEIDRLATYEDMMECWKFRDITEVERIFRRVNALGGTDKIAEYKRIADKIVHCRDCKHMYFKDFEAFCPHRVGPCRPSGFCERGEMIPEEAQ